jgi:hypothetical protein
VSRFAHTAFAPVPQTISGGTQVSGVAPSLASTPDDPSSPPLSLEGGTPVSPAEPSWSDVASVAGSKFPRIDEHPPSAAAPARIEASVRMPLMVVETSAPC